MSIASRLISTVRQRSLRQNSRLTGTRGGTVAILLLRLLCLFYTCWRTRRQAVGPGTMRRPLTCLTKMFRVVEKYLVGGNGVIRVITKPYLKIPGDFPERVDYLIPILKNLWTSTWSDEYARTTGISLPASLNTYRGCSLHALLLPYPRIIFLL